MEIPQLNASSCVIPITLSLWTWTRFKSPLRRYTSDSRGFQRQTRAAHLAFLGLLLLECLALFFHASVLRWFLCFGSATIFLGFAISSEAREGQFWGKERNRAAGVTLTIAASSLIAILLTDPIFLPLFAGLAIASMCHKRFELELERQSRDLEALHAKLLKQEAQSANDRHFRYTN